MILSLSLVGFLLPALALTSAPLKRATYPQGIDVSHYQASVDFTSLKSAGVVFAYIKATEGTTIVDATFSDKYTSATNGGVIRGGYHFAHPDTSTGAAQASYFLAHGGGWTGDGITLPGAVDLEGDCAGLSTSAMVSWIEDFSATYKDQVGRSPVIYTTTSWWETCTGDSSAFSANPLWLAEWSSSIGAVGASWSYPSFWQYADSGAYPGDQDYFVGDSSGLSTFATG